MIKFINLRINNFDDFFCQDNTIKREECVICMEKIKDKDCVTTECGHRFHASCFFKNNRLSALVNCFFIKYNFVFLNLENILI